MAEILLIRHAESYANKRDAAFGNEKSPLTPKGIEQALALSERLIEEFGIDPKTYDHPVAASEFLRTQQTAEIAGFSQIHVRPLINESEVDRDIMSGVDVVRKHRDERWSPEESCLRAGELDDRIVSGDYDYQIYFAHGMFIASYLLVRELRYGDFSHIFDEKRGYVPLQTGITVISKR